MIIKEQLDMQRKVDGIIAEKIGMSFNETLEMRKLAFKVELGELANEIGSFKYWKETQTRDKTLILGEWADCLAFLLSITNQTMGLGEVEFFPIGKASTMTDKEINYWINDSMTKLMRDKLDYYSVGLNDVFKTLYEIPMLLGYTVEEMHEAYKTKSQVNVERAKVGY